MELEIHLPGHSPQRVQKTTTVPLVYIPQAQPGSTINVLADPARLDDENRIELLWGAFIQK